LVKFYQNNPFHIKNQHHKKNCYLKEASRLERNKKSRYQSQIRVISATTFIGAIVGGIIGYLIAGDVIRIEVTFLGALIGGITATNLKFIFKSLRRRRKK
jgi:uncharacterized protein YcfJ